MATVATTTTIMATTTTATVVATQTTVTVVQATKGNEKEATAC